MNLTLEEQRDEAVRTTERLRTLLDEVRAQQVARGEHLAEMTFQRGELEVDVRWLMQELADQSEVVDRIPEHLCGFEVAPETGHCEFHERWFDAASHSGLLDEWNAEDVTT